MKNRSFKRFLAGLLPFAILAIAFVVLWVFLENSLAFSVLPDFHVFLIRTGFLAFLFLLLASFSIITGMLAARMEMGNRLRDKHHELATRLRRNMEEAQIGEWKWDVESKRIAWSEETFRLFGVHKEMFDPSLERFRSFFHPADQALFMENLERALQNGVGFKTTCRIIRPIGIERTMEISGRPECKKGGRACAVAGLIRDITESVNLKELARDRQNRLQALTDVCQDALIVLDNAGRVVSLNPRAETLLDATAEESAGKNADHYFVFEHQDKENAAVPEPLKIPGDSVSTRPMLTFINLRKDQRRRHVLLLARRFGSGDGRQIALSLREIPSD